MLIDQFRPSLSDPGEESSRTVGPIVVRSSMRWLCPVCSVAEQSLERCAPLVAVMVIGRLIIESSRGVTGMRRDCLIR